MTENKRHSSFFFISPSTPGAFALLIISVLVLQAALISFLPGQGTSAFVRFGCSLVAAVASRSAMKGSDSHYSRLAWLSVCISALFMSARDASVIGGILFSGRSIFTSIEAGAYILSLFSITCAFILLSQSNDSVTRIKRHLNVACIIWITIGIIVLPLKNSAEIQSAGILYTCIILLKSHALLFVFATGFTFYWISKWRRDFKRKLVYILILLNVTLTYLAVELIEPALRGTVYDYAGIFADLIETSAYLALPAAAWADLIMKNRDINASDPRSFNLFYVSRIERIIPGISLLVIVVSAAGTDKALLASFLIQWFVLIALFAFFLIMFEWMSYRSEDSLLAILSISPVAIQITDRRMTKNYFINNSMYALYRTQSVTADNIITTAVSNLKRAELEEAIKTAGYPNTFEADFIRDDGTTFTAQCRIFPAKYYSYGVILIWMNDTTERKQYEETLARERDMAESQSYYRGSMLKNLSAKMLSGYIVGHYRETPGGNEFIFSEMNAQAQEIINNTNNLAGTRFRDVFSDPTSAIVEAVKDVYSTGNSRRLEVYSHNLNKHLLMVIFKPGANEIAIILNDISEQKKAEQLIRENEEKAHRSEKVRDIGQMAGGIAHELNNRLMGISSYLSLIDLKASEPGIKKYTEGIHTIIKESSELIDNVLTFARQIDVQKEKLKIHPLIQGAIAEFSSSRKLHNPVKVSLSADVDIIFCDNIVLYKVFSAILSNAGDAVQDDGTISVSTANTLAGDDPFLSANAPEKTVQYLIIKVKDTGRGIEKENLSRIFDPFFTTKPVGRGRGLGLSAVYGAVQSHGGLIRVESSEGEGTEFIIYFPCTA